VNNLLLLAILTSGVSFLQLRGIIFSGFSSSGYSSREKEEPTGKMIFDRHASVRLGDRTFASGYLQTIVKTMELLGIHKVVMKYNENRPAEQAIFNLNPQMDVLLMPISG
jgi:hypothetical protein